MKNVISGVLSIFFLSSTYYSFFVFEQKVNKALAIQLSIEELKRDQSLFSEEITINMSLIQESLKKIQDSNLQSIISTQDSHYAYAAIACIFFIFTTCLVTAFFVYSAHSIDPIYSYVIGSTNKAMINRNEYDHFVSTYSEKLKTLCETSFNKVLLSSETAIPDYQERILIILDNLQTCTLKIAVLETKLDLILLDTNMLGSSLEEATSVLFPLINNINT